MEMYIRTTRLHLEELEEWDGNSDKPVLRFDFSKLDLSGLNFCDLNIPNSNFNESDLTNACFSFCAISHSTFINANISKGILGFCDLTGSEFCGANMRNVDVSRSNFNMCNFSRADMFEMRHIEDANFDCADFETAFDPPTIRMACPAVGSFYGYKRCIKNKIVTLLIPEDAKRSSATGTKCRCDKAKVINIESCDGSISYETANAFYDSEFVYRVGETVTSDFCDYRYFECAPGIHFFLDKQDAINYH